MASFTPSTDPAAPLPTPRLQTLRPGLSLLPPLSRRGTGPGLVVVCPDTEDSLAIVDGVPWLLVKWAEEGYAVVQVQPRAIRDADGAAEAALRAAYEALVACEECTHESGVGIVGEFLFLVCCFRSFSVLLCCFRSFSVLFCVERVMES